MAAHCETSSEWRRHGTIIVPSVVGLALAATHGFSLGVMIGPLERAFGWSRAEISAGPLIISVMGLFLSPLIGTAIDRVGPRRLALTGVVLYCSALALFGTTSGNILSWWLRWGVIGIGYMLLSSPVWTSAVNSLFSKNRGKALAFSLCGTGLAATFMPSLVNFLLERFGWRDAFYILATSLAVVIFPIVFFLFRSPLDHDRRSNFESSSGPTLSGLTAAEGVRSSSFRKLAVAALVFGVSGTALTVNAVPILISKGFGRDAAAAAAGLIGVGSIVGRLGGGFLLDWFDAKKVAAVSVITPLLFVALILALPGSGLGGSVACLLLGLSVGAEVDAVAYLGARHFGMRTFGLLMSSIAGLLLFGAGVAPLVANMIYDAVKSYDLILWSLIPLCLLAAILFLSLGSYPEFLAAIDRGDERDVTLADATAIRIPAA